MPIQLSTNRLLSWILGIFTAYWVFGLLADPVWYSVVVSACLLVSGVMCAARAIPEAVVLIRRDQIGAGELAVLALALISSGAVWTGSFNILYSMYDRPESWIGPMSAFGRAMIASGFVVLFLSPEATRQGVRWPRWYIMLSAAVVIAVVAFLIGYTASRHDKSALFDLGRSRLLTDMLPTRVAAALPALLPRPADRLAGPWEGSA